MYKRHHKLFLFLLGILLGLSSCDKTPINGDLDGMWQLMTIQTPQGVQQVKENRAYLCIQLQLAEWRLFAKEDSDSYGKYFYSHFSHQGDSLCFFDLCYPSAHTATGSDDRPVTAVDMVEGALAEWGIHTPHTRYRVLQLNANHLTLEKADTVYAFRKF